MSENKHHKESEENLNLEPEVEAFLDSVSNATVPSKKSKEEIWNKIEASIDEEEESTSKSIPLWRYIGVAAAVAAIVTFTFLFNTQEEVTPTPVAVEISTETSETETQILPDGSKVFLNASSSISYDGEWNRELTLKGEAFFEVVKGDKFLVKTEFGDVQVLGTSFNVFARDGNFKVACKTGKVQVRVPEKSIVEDITPGQMIAIDADTVKRAMNLPEQIGNWQKGEFYFDNQPIQEVFYEFERQFSIEIEFLGSDEMLFTGYFENSNDLETALESVCIVMDLQFQKTGQNKFTISEISQ